MQRFIVYYSGHVQGVGFRDTTRHLARGFQVSGFVENLPDGRVHLVVEGNSDEVTRFLDAVNNRLGGCIVSEQRDVLAANGEFSGFSVRR